MVGRRKLRTDRASMRTHLTFFEEKPELNGEHGSTVRWRTVPTVLTSEAAPWTQDSGDVVAVSLVIPSLPHLVTPETKPVMTWKPGRLDSEAFSAGTWGLASGRKQNKNGMISVCF